jgi:nicotinamidase-related amidase
MTRPVGSRTALLLMDLMPLVVPRLAGDEALLHRLVDAAAAARLADVDVVHVLVRFRNGVAEVGPANKVFAVAAAAFSATHEGTDVHPAIPIEADDFVITKKRVSAFSASDLDQVLRARAVGALVLAGVETSGVVLSTLRQAADLDYHVTVLNDGCADRDRDVHDLLMDRIFPSQADVVSTREWCADLRAVR